MPSIRTPSVPIRSILLLVCAFLGGCNSKAADLREWQPTDHDGNQDPKKTGQSTGEAQAAPPGLDEVTLISWSNNCVRCHGKMGRGDGPQAAMFRPRDLGDPSWQATVTDQQMADGIRKGRGAMPPFALPQTTIDSLVKLIRLLNADQIKRLERDNAAAAGAEASATASAPAAKAPLSANAHPGAPASHQGGAANTPDVR